jgi:ABC-type phosphate transport system substrate-binding protein
MESNSANFPAQERDMRSYGLCCILFVLLMPSLSLARDVAVITDKANASSTVSSKDLLKYLKAETTKWPDGRKVTVYLSDPASADGKLLLEKTYNMTPFELKAFAQGHNGNIVILGSDDLVLKAVAANPGAIGVVNVYSINSAIKVLKVDGKLPLERGYLLHGN